LSLSQFQSVAVVVDSFFGSYSYPYSLTISRSDEECPGHRTIGDLSSLGSFSKDLSSESWAATSTSSGVGSSLLQTSCGTAGKTNVHMWTITPSVGTYSIAITTSGFSASISVRSEECTTPELDCVVGTSGVTETIEFTANGNKEYYVFVMGNTNSGPYSLDVTPVTGTLTPGKHF
jgi:hypothetical protein